MVVVFKFIPGHWRCGTYWTRIRGSSEMMVVWSAFCLLESFMT